MAKSNKEHVVGQRLCLHKLNKNSKKVCASLEPYQNKGITLVALMVTVIVLLIITTAGISTSLDRFEINNYRKMKNDLELLEDKVSDYYLKYEGLPVLRTSDSNIEVFNYKEYIEGLTNANQEPDTNDNDNDIYYIIDLEALGNITLNYGKDFEKYKSNNTVDQNVDTDIYVVNEESHTIYYVKGIEMDNVTYHYIKRDEQISDDVPPTAPEIKIVDGNKIDNTEYYEPDVNIEITSGKDKWSGYSKIMYSITKNDAEYANETVYNGNITLSEIGQYTIEAYSLDNQNNKSETKTKTFEINIKNYVGYYADINGDGEVDGIIYADLAVGGSGQWGDSNGTFSYTAITGTKEYYISNTGYVGKFGTKDVISVVPDSKGADRFYVMALEDVTGTTQEGTTTSDFCWYDAAYDNKISDYSTVTSTSFGAGKTNTKTMISKWNASTYGTQDAGGTYKDMWGVIQDKANKGWFVPSKEEWSAFAQNLGIQSREYVNLRVNGFLLVFFG